MSSCDGVRSARAEEMMTLYRRGAELTRQLLIDNERLRHSVAECEKSLRAEGEDPRRQLLAQIEHLSGQIKQGLERIEEVKRENQHFAARCVEISAVNNSLIHLYVAIDQLHVALDLSEVLRAVSEILIDLIGAEVFAVYILDENTNRIKAVAAKGAKASEFPEFELGRGVIGEALASGEVACEPAAHSGGLSRPIVCIPLLLEERPVGAIAIHQFLEQKQRITPLDNELFTLMAKHAGSAIFSARLYSSLARRLAALQSFIDLLAGDG